VDAPAVPAPALWTPPPGERWAPAPAPTGRFARSEAEAAPVAPAGPSFIRPDDDEATAPAPPSFPRFIRPDPEPEPDKVPAGEAVPAGDSDTPEPTTPAPTPLLFGSTPVDAPSPQAPRPLSPWPEGPAPAPYPPVPAVVPDPIAPEADEPWTGSWIPEPATADEPAPEPPATFAPEPTPEPEPEPVPEIVVEPTEVVEAPAPADVVEEVVVDAVEVVEPDPVDETPAVRTWSSTSSRPAASATGADRPHKVNFLVVSGAALVVTGLIAARRGGRH